MVENSKPRVRAYAGLQDQAPPEVGAYAGQTVAAPAQHSIFDGGKFAGGFGPTQLMTADYWTLRARSSQLFRENLYAAGLIKRLVTNEVNVGLSPEATPAGDILGEGEDALSVWSEDVETRFTLWANNPHLCDHLRLLTFGETQAVARQEALIEGDVLVIMHRDPLTHLPSIELVRGGHVTSPILDNIRLKNGHEIRHGVELDAGGRHVAFYAEQADGTHKRIPATGPKSGRRIAWLVYGSQKRLDDVRGMPLLAIMLQSFKEIDRYRDSAQRKAVVNSILAMYIKKTEDKPGTLPVTGGAVRRTQGTATDSDGGTRNFNIAEQVPGVVYETLQTGEEPVGFHSQGTDINFPIFESAVLRSIAWSNEMPPEILELSFASNYSASQAAINEFKIYLNRRWSTEGSQLLTPVYVDFLTTQILTGKIKAKGFLAAWRDPMQYDTYTAWIAVEWYGSIKPSTDMLKQAKGSKILIDEGWSTNAREARMISGTKFSQNAKRLKRENQLKVEMARPVAEFKQEFGEEVANAALEATANAMDEANFEAILDDYLEEKGALDAG